ncbi:PapC N-terminal domain [Vibrio sp. B1REV9]|uniref:fimbria/pilus outer membrane usher protein n=1 Tax=Vibrio sp. B1REV9 TaxID=2751179 RepID=UPI001AF75C62|nr:fimbria/pilus outer membrane usher protein [Vibrio sp. B1REV9]CAE6937580.1 PapC N-terminal domain [Vibrio sp. B1REV9]
MRYTLFLLLICFFVHAESELPLDTDFFRGNAASSEELSSLMENKLINGVEYFFDVSVNDKPQGLRSYVAKIGRGNRLCFDKWWLDKLNTKIDYEYYEQSLDGSCYVLAEDENTRISTNLMSQQLFIQVPQEALKRNFSVVHDWNYGTSALKANYNLDGLFSENVNSISLTSSYSFNVMEWQGEGGVSCQKDGCNIGFSSISRPIKAWEADLSLGLVRGTSRIAGGTGMFGVSIQSNSSMKPGARGYHPDFRGVSRTFATISLVQNERILYSEVVPPGPFKIDNVNIYDSGDIILKIEESDGRKYIRTYPFTLLSGMLSPGEQEFGLNAGFKSQNTVHKSIENGDLFLSGDYRYGFPFVTVGSGMLLNDKYTNIGVSYDMGFGIVGALNIKSNYSVAKYKKGDVESGFKLESSYYKNINDNFSFGVLGTQYISDTFNDFSSYDYLNTEHRSFKSGLHRQISSNVGFSYDELGSFGISIWSKKYFSNRESKGINFSYGRSILGGNLSLGGEYAYNNKLYDNNSSSLSLYFSVSVPFELFGKSTSSNISTSLNNGRFSTTNLNLSSSVSRSLDVSSSFGISSEGDLDSIASGLYYSGEKFRSNIGLWSSKYSTSISGGLSGGFLLLPDGTWLFDKNSTGTVMIAHVSDVENASFYGVESKTNRDGNVVVPLSSYSMNNVILKGDSLPMDYEIVESENSVFPVDGAVIYKEFEVLKVKRYFLRVKDKNREVMMAGKWAKDGFGTPLGFVVDDGIVSFSTVKDLNYIYFDDCKVDLNKVSLDGLAQISEVECE